MAGTPSVVVTLSFNAKMVLADFGYNIKRLGTTRNGFKKVTCSLWERRGSGPCGNVEGADLKNNSQITTHIDPKVGGKSQAPACSVSDKGQAYD